MDGVYVTVVVVADMDRGGGYDIVFEIRGRFRNGSYYAF